MSDSHEKARERAKELAHECARELALRSGNAVTVLDMRNCAHWTDFFVIATGSSSVALGAMETRIEERLAERGMKPFRGNRTRYASMKRAGDDETGFGEDEWKILDYGDFVVHLMSARAREFYELEKLWFQSERTEIAPPEAGQERTLQ